jgi:hypothetical protein
MLAYLPPKPGVDDQRYEVTSDMADELNDLGDIEMQAANLYQEETFTDRRVGTLQRLTPITADGARDPQRPILFVGQTQILTPAGALPLSFEIEAETLEQAVAQFGDHAKSALTNAMHRLEELRREAASSIIVPSGGMPGGGRGGVPPGGGIQMP